MLGKSFLKVKERFRKNRKFSFLLAKFYASYSGKYTAARGSYDLG